MNEYTIYHLFYGTSCTALCNAIIAAKNSDKAESLLESAIKNDEKINKRFRENTGLKIDKTEPTKYRTNKEGVIYFE